MNVNPTSKKKRKINPLLFVFIIAVSFFIAYAIYSQYLLTQKSTYRSRAESVNIPKAIVSGYPANPLSWPFFSLLVDIDPRCVYVDDLVQCNKNKKTTPIYNSNKREYSIDLTGVKKFCGATVIENNWAVTAAHCVLETTREAKYKISKKNDFSGWYIAIGFIDLINQNTIDNNLRYFMKIDKVIPHELYGEDGEARDSFDRHYDIALIHFTKSIYSPHDLPQDFPTISYNDDIDLMRVSKSEEKKVTLAGFGMVSLKHDIQHITFSDIDYLFPDVLREIVMNVYSTQNSDVISPTPEIEFIQLSNISNVIAYAGGSKLDSGGPAVSLNNGRRVQIGVISHGNYESGADFTKITNTTVINIARFADWIKEKTGIQPNSGNYFDKSKRDLPQNLM